MYKGTAPKKLKKPSPPPTRLSQGVKKTQKPSYKRPTKDPLQGLRESKEEEKMIKFQPKPVEEQNPVKPVLDRKHGLQKKPVPGIEKKQENSTELEEETPIERDLPRQEKIPSNASSPDPMEMPPPTSTRRPIPPASPRQDRRWLIASAAAILFLGGVILYKYASPTQSPIILSNSYPGKTSPDAPKSKDLSSPPSAPVSRRRANVAKAIEVLTDVFGERCSTSTEDLVDFGGEGILGLGEGMLPNAVVWPVSTEEVEVILKVAETYRVPVIPYSGGTSLEG